MLLFLGTSAWDHIIRPSPTLIYGSPGGSALNAAATAAEIGEQAVLLSALGSDEDGDRIRRACESKRNLRAHFASVPDTPRSYIIDHEDREMYSLSPSPLPAPPPEHFRDADIVDFYPGLWRACDVYRLLRDVPRAISARHLEKEVRSGRTWSIAIDSVAVCPPPSEELLRRSGVQLLVLTDAERGGWWWDGQWHRFCSPAVQAVDSVGAGDAFRGALLVALRRGMGNREAIEAAARIGAQAAARRGGFPVSLDSSEWLA